MNTLRSKVLAIQTHSPYNSIMASRPEPILLHDHAIDNLRFIRDTMERAGSFTAVPGSGGIAMGLSAFAAAMAVMAYPGSFLTIWLVEAMIALAIGMVSTIWKARGIRVLAGSGPARKFAWSFAPPLIVGVVLTVVLVRAAVPGLLPGVWLCVYGVAIIAGGAFSVRVIPIMGVGFLCAGIAAFCTPSAWGNAWLASAFGGLHVVFGAIIARRYGG
jgi:hypothetical protein